MQGKHLLQVLERHELYAASTEPKATPSKQGSATHITASNASRRTQIDYECVRYSQREEVDLVWKTRSVKFMALAHALRHPLARS